MNEVDKKIKRDFDSIVKKTKKSFENPEIMDYQLVDRILEDMLGEMLENEEYREKVKKELREDKLKRIVDEEHLD